MACFFGHKWNGCTCSKCGQTRDQDHRWQPVSGKCIEKCAICGSEKEIPHKFERLETKCAEKCSVCGEERPVPHQFADGRCIRCGIERNSLGTPEFVEVSESYPQSGNGAELATWIDDMLSRFQGCGSWELLEPACRAYSDSFLSLAKELIDGEFFDSKSPSDTAEEGWGTRLADLALRKYLSNRIQNGEWEVSASEWRFNSIQVKPGQLHPGVMLHYLDSKLQPKAEPAANASPIRLPRIIADKEHCNTLVAKIYKTNLRDSETALPEDVYILLTETIKSAF